MEPPTGYRSASGSRSEGGTTSCQHGRVRERVGIRLGPTALQDVVRGNLVRGNAVGLLAAAGSQGATIAGNRFEDNRIQARDEGNGNRWDDGRWGNYWSDLRGVDADGDGVLDQQREIPSEGVDRYPLAEAPD